MWLIIPLTPSYPEHCQDLAWDEPVQDIDITFLTLAPVVTLEV